MHCTLKDSSLRVRALRYIKQNRRALYLDLLTSSKMNGYLADIDKQAEEMFSKLCHRYFRQKTIHC